jgi:hypothetical protein
MSKLQPLFNFFKRTLPMPLLVLVLKMNGKLRPAPQQRVFNAFDARVGSPKKILAGPFKGMTYIREARGSELLAKLLGTYELELNGAIDRMIRRQPDLVVDVGCAEGYYAIGLAVRIPAARIVAFDTDRYAQHLLKRLAKLNGVDSRTTPGNFCTPELLQRTIAPALRPSLVCDCEGFEQHLLRPDLAPDLARTDILVELHDAWIPGLQEEIRRRFSATHDIEQIDSRPRKAQDLQVPVNLTPQEIEQVICEARADGRQTWFYMTPRG